MLKTMYLDSLRVHVTQSFAILTLVRESECVVARTKKGLESAWRDFKRAYYFCLSLSRVSLKTQLFVKKGL